MSEMSSATYDVVIVGGGPVGLVTAYGLKTKGISTLVIERDDKALLPEYGRAVALYPRTIELLDQYKLLDAMNQIGFIARSSATYDSNGRRVTTRGWHTMFDQMGSTFLDYCLNIRLKYSEETLLQAYRSIGGEILIGWEVNGLKSQTTSSDPITVQVRNAADKLSRSITANYLVGADGGRSTIRRLADMTSERVQSVGPPLKWIRIDGTIKTNMPNSALGYGTIESQNHGTVLWCNLDHGRTRIGYCLPADKALEFADHITEEQAVEEARKAMSPWKITVDSVDWFTNYSIHQSLAKDYIKNHIILAGDACHTHSSGAAQGMNTGVQDAVNLTWKLAGVIKGWYSKEVLHTYASERRATAQHLIELDQIYSRLISGQIPLKYQGWSDDPHVVLGMVFEEQVRFNIGLGVSYTANVLNRRALTGNVTEGHRAPDALVYRPGSRIPVRIQQITPNTGAIWIIVFTGEPLVTGDKISAFRSSIGASASLQKMQQVGLVKYITILPYERPLAETIMGGPPFGHVYYDHDASAHHRYGLSTQGGGVAVVRPDGYLGFAAPLEEGKEIETYFQAFINTDGLR